MPEFSIKQAAFAGWGLIARKPGLFIALAVVSLIVSFLGYGLIMGSAGALLAEAARMSQDGDMAAMSDPAVAMKFGAASMQVSALAIVISLVTYVLSAAAVARALVRPGKSVPPYIGLGGGEMRQLLAGLVIGGILFLVVMVGVTVFSIIGVVVASMRGEMQQMVENPGVLPPTMQVFTYGGSVLAYIAAFLLGVRFALAPAQTEHEESTKIFSSWGLAKGRYWRMAGAYALAILTLLPFYVLTSVVTLAMKGGAGGSVDAAMRSMMQPDWSQGSVFAPSVVVFIILQALTTVLAWIVCLGSSCSIYAQVVGVAGAQEDDDDDDDDDDED